MRSRIASLVLRYHREAGLDHVTRADCDERTWRRIECLRAEERNDWELAARLDDGPGDLSEVRRRLEARNAGIESKQMGPIDEAIERARRRSMR